MRSAYGRAIPALWLGWTAIWAASSLGVKRAARRESLVSWASHHLLLFAAGALLAMPRRAPFPPRSPLASRLGTAGVAGGLGFALASRACLGRNWSGAVTVKQGHELIQAGPYRLVRHPIYTGMLLAFLGTAAARGDKRGLAAVLLATASFLLKARVEERFMVEQFPQEYPGYRVRTPALIPRLARSRKITSPRSRPKAWLRSAAPWQLRTGSP